MNRRDFFKFAFAVAASSQLPSITSSAAELSGEFISLDAMRRAVDTLKRATAPIVDGSYILWCHSDVLEDLTSIADPKTAWKIAYRQARMELKKMAGRFAASTEFGSIENVRFITSPTLA